MADKESVKVVVRCRPFSQREKEAGHSCVVSMDLGAATVSLSDPKSTHEPPKTFTFDSVFDISTKQIDVYNKTARPIVESVLNGYNGTIFAYGQTGTGKTFSMEGIRDVPELRGIIPNAFEHIFSEINQAPAGTQYLVRASYLEIYNEDIRDLLNPKTPKLELKERSDTGVYVKDLSTFAIKDVEEMDKLMSMGNKNRSVGATLMNQQSSRSHSIFSITVERSEMGPDGQEHICAGKLHLVDLAGSERQSKTGATGDRLKEATKINLSLSALGNVISALVDGKSSHIPYRDSKLTRLLQDSLGGNSRTMMLATMSPASYNYDETLSTLRYANRAKSIKNKPKVNEDPKDTMLREFQEEINRLKQQLEGMGGAGAEAIVEIEEDDEDEDDDQEDGDQGPVSGSSGKLNKKSKKSKKQRGSQSKLDGHIAEMQAKVEAEKKAILESRDLVESEKKRLLSEIEARAQELDKERNARETLASKLASLQQKLLVGGVNLIDKDQEQQQLLAKQTQELEEQRRKERELERQLLDHDETNLQIEEEYASLQEEAAAKTKKLKTMWNMLQKHKTEAKDVREEHQREREDLLETIRDLTRELKMQLLVINSFIPPNEQRLLEEHAEYDEVAEKWRIAHIAHAGNNIRGKRPLGPAQQEAHLIHRQGKGGKENDLVWDPLCLFTEPYLVYETPASPTRKRGNSRKSTSRKSSMSPQRQAPQQGNPDAATPKARGLVSKTKHYA